MPLHRAVTVHETDSLDGVLHHFVDNKIGSLVVVDRSSVIGIVTERDLVMKLDPLAPSSRLIGSLMTANPKTLPGYASIARALHTFSSGGFRHIPVLNNGGRAAEICSVRDVIDFIYQRLAKRFLENDFELEAIADEQAVQSFFESPVEILEPHAAYSVSTECSSYEALVLLRANKIGSLVAVDEAKQVRGIVTERDLLTKVLASGKDANTLSVAEVMTNNPKTVLISSSVSRALSFLSEGRFRHLPVVDHNEALVGMLSVKNFVQFLSNRIINELR